jgi:hypothetical protein
VERHETGVQRRQDGAYVAGEYWRELEDICAHRGCQVAAGDFIDSAMENPWNKNKAEEEKDPHPGYAYFHHQYVEGMGKAPKAYHWSWHAYEEGEQVATRFHGGHANKWWKPSSCM